MRRVAMLLWLVLALVVGVHWVGEAQQPPASGADDPRFTGKSTPMEGKDGPYADYVSTLAPEAKAFFRDKLRQAYVDGEADGARSYAATAWVVKGKVPI